MRTGDGPVLVIFRIRKKEKVYNPDPINGFLTIKKTITLARRPKRLGMYLYVQVNGIVGMRLKEHATKKRVRPIFWF